MQQYRWTKEVAEGIKLEGILHSKSSSSTGQGTLHAPFAWWRIAQCSEVSAVLRYNRRGVGKSTGRVCLRADIDCQDLHDICKDMARTPAAALTHPSKLIVIGYSWGSVMAAHAATFTQVAAVACISPPVGRLVNIALHSHRHFRALAEPEALPKPKHVIFGTADGFTSCRTTTLFFDNCNKEIRQQSNVTPTRPIYRVELIGVGNAGHFWHTSNHLALMMKEVREFVQSCVLIEHSFEAFALVP